MRDELVQVSVITAVYNKSKYLEDYVRSLKEQSFQHFEVICVEDCSTDDSKEHLQRLTDGDYRFKIVQNHENCGLSVSRNRAMKLCKGKYICFLDADDCLTPEALEVLFILAEKDDLQGVFYSAREYTEDMTRVVREIQYKGDYPVCDGKTLMNLMHNNHQYQSATGFQFWRRDFLLEEDISFIPGILYEDTIFTLDVLCKAKRVRAVPNMLYQYRYCGNSISHSLGSNQLQSCVLVYGMLLNFAKEFARDTRVMAELKERINLFEKRIDHIVCIAEDELALDFKDEYYSHIMEHFLERDEYPFLRKVSVEELDKIRNSPQVYVFGDGMIAEEILAYLRKENIIVDGIIVSGVKTNTEWKGFALFSKEKFCEEGMVVIAVTSKWRDSLEAFFAEKGNETMFVSK